MISYNDSIPWVPAPGDEGLDLSHEGGKYEALQGLSHQMADLSGFCYMDPRTQHDCIELQTSHWDMQMNQLVNAYLDYRSRDSGDGMPSLPSYPNKTLIYHGYLGCTPLYPTVAISLCTLAAYQQAHRTCLRFSLQAAMLYRLYLHTQFSAVYDAFLKILHRVDVLLKQALKHDTPNWRLLNACPPCTYKLEDEPSLQFKWFATIDGNNSLKCWVSHNSVSRDDSCQPRTDYWIGRNVVDKFKDDIRSRTVGVCFICKHAK
ncbi:uncharacterized protein EDB93DRAFT_1094973 [Suillus bovinus]|uniref:uncharacterized protein n=1 Tax=Suillus bovinus TaxID=48563 RepID=UPI001B872F01|nr:uncharacterized protein EDB93DRAFT_1094973 [Suillus bovinus]KAG2130280.1 hypothetical protein EDB93DRAFT_1094973 [Suillus bovinus]